MTYTRDLPLTDESSERIGPYRILQVLGEGGMGIVYEAEETETVRRRVALKVVKDRHASKEVIARFEIERQALAVMNHPGIAKVYSAGTTSTGQPYFAMELVRGLPITQYCDEHRLSVRERLELFVAVCHAVQHAHQKGLIHRDLKPSNILVTDADGAPQPKVIDFGIAKALGQQLTDITLITQFGHAVGTAAYMSPEQAESSAIDIDTRTDIYSLGVLLYEVLVGELPTDPAAIGIHAYLAQLMARETNPPTPSRRLDKLRTDSGLIVRARQTDLPRLRRELRGDLDWIVMKAMDGDRARRYATANGLAVDIQRYLSNEPIIARPPSAGYRIGKFVRRHRAATIGASLAAAAVLASSVFTTIGMIRATRAERVAASEAEAARQVTEFLVDIFRISNRDEARGSAVTARELLDRGAQRIGDGLSEQPELQSRLLHTIGMVYTSLGLYPQARTALTDALRIREATFGPTDTLVAQTLHELGAATAARGELDDADRFLGRALAIREDARGTTDQEYGRTLAVLATLRMRQGRLAEAESLATLAVGIHDRPGIPPKLLVRSLAGLGAIHLASRDYAAAEPYLRRTLSMQVQEVGADHPDLAPTYNNLGIIYYSLGRYTDALPLYERTRRIYATTYPAGHPDVASSLNNVAETYWKLGRLHEAEPLFREALSIKTQMLAPMNPSIAVTLNGLAGLLRDRGRYPEAESLYVRALDIRRRSLGNEDGNTVETRRDYAVLLRATGRADDAAAMDPR